MRLFVFFFFFAFSFGSVGMSLHLFIAYTAFEGARARAYVRAIGLWMELFQHDDIARV